MRYLMPMLLCLGVLMANAQDSQKFSHLMTGYVKDRDGRPVPRAKVCAEPHSGWTGPIPCGESDEDGSFSLRIWRPGTYTISAESKVLGYPNAWSGFYGSFFGELPVVNVGESNDSQPVEVIVGPQAGRVILRIVDDESDTMVERGAVEVCRTDKPKMCSDTSTGFPQGIYEFLAPEVPFTLKIRVWSGSNGWEERYAVDENNEGVDLLQVASGERKQINIKLRRYK